MLHSGNFHTGTLSSEQLRLQHIVCLNRLDRVSFYYHRSLVCEPSGSECMKARHNHSGRKYIRKSVTYVKKNMLLNYNYSFGFDSQFLNWLGKISSVYSIAWLATQCFSLCARGLFILISLWNVGIILYDFTCVLRTLLLCWCFSKTTAC